jgi:hypothetical protein
LEKECECIREILRNIVLTLEALNVENKKIEEEIRRVKKDLRGRKGKDLNLTYNNIYLESDVDEREFYSYLMTEENPNYFKKFL